MILIISSEEDNSTNLVIRWLKYFNKNFIRINGTTNVSLSKLVVSDTETDFELILNDSFHQNKKLLYSEITSVWYRRGFIHIVTNAFENNQLELYLRRFLIRENEHIENFIYHLLGFKRHINTYFDDQEVNKIEVLLKAKECGLKIPDTLVSAKRESFYKFIDANSNGIISKAVRYASFNDMNQKYIISAGTKLVSRKHIKKFPASFFPSLVQENVKKKYEIRSFYIHDKFYSVAIFSQLDPQTSVDFREYNYQKPNRTPPFLLPNDIKSKLTDLMKLLNFNSGSIDLIVTEKDEFVFLEVNPVGQFEQISTPGNFFLDKKIAKFLN